MAIATKKPGEITADALYTLDELNDRLGLGKAALRKARREGLVVKRIGRRGYCTGRAILDWFESSAKQV
jgi:dienelactone hydrolase